MFDNSKWHDNYIQFPRLIAEIASVCDDKLIEDVAKEMDLEIEDVNALLDRATTIWEALKPT